MLSNETADTEKSKYKLQHCIKLANDRKIYLPAGENEKTSLKYDLDIFIHDMIDSSMDIVIVADGKEGTGKSQSVRVIAAYISSITGVPFGVDNIHFNTDDYLESSEKGGKYQVNILDESREALNRRRGMARGNLRFLNWLSENRDKRQVHIITLPAVHDLESYITTWRMTMLLHHLKIHKKDETSKSGWRLVRGFFRVYKANRHLQAVIHNRQKYGWYAYPKIQEYRRKFMDCDPFSQEEYDNYETKKHQKRLATYTELRKPDFRKQLATDMSAGGMTNVKIAGYMKVEPSQVSRWLKSVRDNSVTVPKV